MKYAGTKTVEAKPMTRGAYCYYRGWDLPADEKPTDAGYLIEYTDGGKANDSRHVGYISWSPQDVFERSYKPVAEPKYALPHQQRVFEEWQDLDRRINALDVFIGGAVYTGLPSEERSALVDQDAVMRKLRSILSDRIRRF